MNRLRHEGASESYVTTAIFFAIACLSVGQSAVASVAETRRTLAPFVIAAWIAGICDAAVACVPLVSLPMPLSSRTALSAPPDFTLSDVVKYALPRFFGMTKTLRPVFREVAADAVVSSTTPIRVHAPIDAVSLNIRLFTGVPFTVRVCANQTRCISPRGRLAGHFRQRLVVGVTSSERCA